MPSSHTITPLLLLPLLLLFLLLSPTTSISRSTTRDLSRHLHISSRKPRGPITKPHPRPSPIPIPSVGTRIPLYSAADLGLGEYVAEVSIGTPGRTFRLFADTGSDLTWVNCNHGAGSFRTDDSASFKAVECGSKECSKGLADLFSLATCPLPKAPCFYNYSYQSNSLVAYGKFGKEIITLPLQDHRKLSLPNTIGCTESTQGTTALGGADGVLGLSYSKYSFAYRTATKYGGGKFSYCLVDHLSSANVTRGFLAFGDQHGTDTRIKYTKLFLHSIDGFYVVSVHGISVGGVMLKIPRQVWDVRGPGGAILDSGTSLTVLAPPAYKPVMEALRKALSPRFPSLGKAIEQPFGYCFNSTGFKESMVPRLVIHFSDGARFQPHVKSYIIDDRPQIKCVGILEGPGPGVPYLSIFGNILQQNYLWEYDLVKEKLGFGASTCL